MRMSYLYNIFSIKSPPSLYEVIPALQRSHCYTVCFNLCLVGLNFFKTYLYHLLLMNWINWTLALRTTIFMLFFEKKLVAFIRPVGNIMHGIYDPFGVRLINRLQLGFSHWRTKVYTKFCSYCEPVMFMNSWNWKYRVLFSKLQNNLSSCTTLMKWTKKYQQWKELFEFNWLYQSSSLWS